MTLVEDDARSTTMRHPHLYARTSWPCLKVTGLLATSHSPSAFVKRSPMRRCSGKMATDSADEGRLRFGHATPLLDQANRCLEMVLAGRFPLGARVADNCATRPTTRQCVIRPSRGSDD